MRQAASAHVDELVRAASGAAEGRDLLISQSWRRCLDQYGLDPGAPRRAYIHTHQRLREHRDAMDDLIRVARFGVETLYRQVSGLGYVLILSDAKGVAVDFIGDPRSDEALRSAGLYRGSDWSEPLAGTCAVGTCITTGTALTVHLDDHFAGDHIGLTCTAAPIHAADGTLAAVLDISALRSPTPKASQFLALQLVTAFAHRIETASLHNGFRRDWIVHLSRAPAFADIEPDLALAVDGDGRIVGLNSQARRLVERVLDGTGAGAAPRRGALGARFDAVFEASVDDLPGFTRARPVEGRVLRARGGEAFFALAHGPAAAGHPRATTRPAPPPAGDTDPAVAALRARAGRLLGAGLTVLLGGETGTGKEHLARALHAGSRRAGKPFVPVNCAALPETLIESELFGYEAGAFTGASGKGRRGLLREADGGTLFLDEIGDMPLAAQTRLLRVLSEREVTAVGAARPRPLDLQVIAASHRDLEALVAEGRFREDLLFRLGGGALVLPPLRARSDFDALLARFLARHPAAPPLSRAAREALGRHAWPGNLRELATVLDHACALAEGPEIGLDDLPPRIARPRAPLTGARPPAAGPETPAASPLEETLRRCRWNVSAAARELALDRSTVHRRMRRLGLVPPNRLG